RVTIDGYTLLRGKARRWLDASAASPHGQVLVECAGGRHRVAVDVTSPDRPHELLYLVDGDYQHAITASLLAEAEGLTPLRCEPGGRALDCVRGHLCEPRRMRPVPVDAGAANDLVRVLGATIARAIDETDAVTFAFGRATHGDGPDPYFDFAPARAIVDTH